MPDVAVLQEQVEAAGVLVEKLRETGQLSTALPEFLLKLPLSHLGKSGFFNNFWFT
jgi:hypothetical protein